MNRPPVSELDAKKLLRDMDRKIRAQKVLDEPLVPRWIPYLVIFFIALVSAPFSRKLLEGQDTTVILGALIGALIGLTVELWFVQRKLEALLLLFNMDKREPSKLSDSPSLVIEEIKN